MNYSDITSTPRYAGEKHTQILIALMKKHGIRRIIASPGATNASFVGSIQSDPYFQIYSSVDERSAAYMAVGMAAESGEPVALTCTGSTASRNYIPGLTEAYYRKLPVLAITATQPLGRVGQYRAQVIDRSSPLADIVTESVNIDVISSREDEWDCTLKINKALLALTKNGGGPSHINLVTTYNADFSATVLPDVKKIDYFSDFESMPVLENYKHIAILVGVHSKWSDKLHKAVEDFCRSCNAVVLNSHSSNYKGDYGFNLDLIRNMKDYVPKTPSADLVIFIGTIPRYISGMKEKEMWRVNPDGEIRDVECRLTKVFAMEEADFFNYYVDNNKTPSDACYARQWQNENDDILKNISNLPFSNVWIAKETSSRLPENCVFHMSGSNTARSWNFFPLSKTIDCYSNDGAMGIDGQMSSLLGESLVSPDRLHFGAVGDLTFFYDMNCLGNRHVGNNIRLLIVNNGKGTEFRIYSNQPSATLGEEADKFIAAAGHFGNKSHDLIKHYAEDLGFEYLCASSKDEFLKVIDRFTTPQLTDKSIIFEVFTDSENENEAIYIMNHLSSNAKGVIKSLAKKVIKTLPQSK